LDIGVLVYIVIVWPKEHSPEVRSFPPGTPCIYIYIWNSFYQHCGLRLRKKLLKCYIWAMALFGTESWTLRNIVSIAKPTRCTDVSYYFILELHSTCFGRASSQQHLFDKCLLLYVQSWTPDDGRKDRPKHVECHSKIKVIWYIGTFSWFYSIKFITMHGPVNVKFGTLIRNTWKGLKCCAGEG